MNLRLKKEVYAPLADFDAKVIVIKNLKSGIALTEKKKNASGSLYEEAGLNTELNF